MNFIGVKYSFERELNINCQAIKQGLNMGFVDLHTSVLEREFGIQKEPQDF
jgi:hypothetical protein